MGTFVPEVIVDDIVEEVPATPHQQLLHVHVLDLEAHLKWLPWGSEGEVLGEIVVVPIITSLTYHHEFAVAKVGNHNDTLRPKLHS